MGESYLLSILTVIHPAIKAAIKNAGKSEAFQKIAQECQ